jgi:hypothetical protein
MKKARACGPFAVGARRASAQAALNHIEVSNALHIIGMFMPKLAFAAAFEVVFGLAVSVLGAAACWATSVARSHDPFSWERATEKNKNT